MTTPATMNTHRSDFAGFEGGFDEFRERQVVFQLTRRLVEAQFRLGDRCRSDRLWQEAAALAIDPERIVSLLYGVDDHADDEAMDRVDRFYREDRRRRSRQRRWHLGHRSGITRRRAGWHRNGPPAGARERRAVR